jgi:hypothetical protein
MNNLLLVRAEKFLGELNIETQWKDNVLLVSRDSMANWPVEPGDLLGELQAECRTTKLFWGSKDDTWLQLESF